MLLGLVAIPGLQRETFPEIQNDKVEIRVIYKGATAEEVEDAICRRIEDSLESIVDLEELRCESREGMGIATAIMLEGAVMARFLDDVKSEIEAIDDFPSFVETPIIEELGRTDSVVSIAITGPQDAVKLKNYAEDVKQRIQALGSVANVTINGFSEHQLLIEVPAMLLRQYGLSAAELASTIQKQSVSSPAGQIEGQFEDIILRFDDQRKSTEELADLVVITGKSGAAIRLGDIAKITDRFEKDEEKIYFDGQRAAVLAVTKTGSQDVLNVFSSVEEFVNKEQQHAPTGIKLTLTQDVSSVVSDRLNMLVKNGVQGLILVFLVLWLFFSFRYSFWVTMGLPVSFLGAFFVLPLLGVTINMISMVGLLIGIGLLMDDAIVIAENIAARLHKGEKSLSAAVSGVTQVLPGITSSFATTLFIFGSLAFISGEIGQILRIMPIVLIVVISVSLLEAFFILPNHLGHSLTHIDNREDSKFRIKFESAFNVLRDKWFGSVLDNSLEYRYLTVGIVIMLLLIAIAMPVGGKLKFVGFPSIEGDIVEARILLPQGTPLSQTEQIVSRITQALKKVNQKYQPLQVEQQDLIRHVTVFYGENPDAHETGPHVARVVADLLSAEIRQNVSLQEIQQLWREETGLLTDIISLTYAEPYAPSNGDQAAFIGSPIIKNGQTIGVVALQLPIERINAITQRRNGMSPSGENYLVGKGDDGKTALRSDRVVKKAKIGKAKSGKFIDKALAGESGFSVKIGSSGAVELVGYFPINIKGLQWALMSSVSLEEVLAGQLDENKKGFFDHYMEINGYYDIFLIHPKGRVFYSVTKEADYQTNMVNGKFKDSSLGKAVRKSLQTKEHTMSDLEPYAPSNGDPAAFIVQPVLDKNNNVELLLAIQMPQEKINKIMQERTGMGETGETYIVGSDKLMRSDSFLDPKGHSVKASFAGTVKDNGVDTEALKLVAEGKTISKEILDYNGNIVLSAFTPLDYDGFFTTRSLRKAVFPSSPLPTR